MATLARIYSVNLQKARSDLATEEDARAKGGRGTAEKSAAIMDRRSTVRRFVTEIQRWSENIYPPARWLAFTRSTQPNG